MKFFLILFLQKRNHMVPRACNTRLLIIVFDSAEVFGFYTFPRMLSSAMKSVPRMLSVR
jgi:hypothetical protein